MSNTKHTPGPWSLCYDGQIDGSDGRAICRFSWDSFKEFNEGNNAQNARLIAAAPELLEALEAWEKAIPRLDEFASVSPDSLRGKALAAIAKARGE